MKEANVDAVYVGGYHTEAGLILRQMREQGMKAQMISGDALVTDEFWSITGDAGEGTIMTFAPDPRNYPEAKKVVDEFKADGYNPKAIPSTPTRPCRSLPRRHQGRHNRPHEGRRGGGSGGVQYRARQPVDDSKGEIKNAKYVWYKWHDGHYAETSNP